MILLKSKMMDSQLSHSPASSSISTKYFDTNTMDTYLSSETSSANSNKDFDHINNHNQVYNNIDLNKSRISVINKSETKVKLNFSVERILSNDCEKQQQSSEILCLVHNLPSSSCSECLANNVKHWKVVDTPSPSASPPIVNETICRRPIPRYARAPPPGNKILFLK